MLTEIFCEIDDFCIKFKDNLIGLFPKSKMYLSEIMTLVVNFHLSNYRTFKHYIQFIKQYLYKEYVSNIIDLPKENFRKFYTLRWQIELVFKNWKSNFKLEKVSGIKIQRIKCMIYSKPLMIIISTKLIYQIRNICWKEFKIEISEFKASKHFILTFQEFFKYVINKYREYI